MTIVVVMHVKFHEDFIRCRYCPLITLIQHVSMNLFIQSFNLVANGWNMRCGDDQNFSLFHNKCFPINLSVAF